MPTLRIAPSRPLPVAVGILTMPSVVTACGVCADSAFNYHFPWLPWIYVVVIAFYFMRVGILWVGESETKPDFWKRNRALLIIIGITCALPALGMLGFFITGGMITLLLVSRMAADLFLERYLLVWILAINLTVGFLLITAIAAVGYDLRWDMSALEAYDRYVADGSGIGRSLPKTLARDPDLDAEDLLPMLNSGDEHRQTKALRILKERRSTQDLLEVGPAVVRILPVEATESKPEWGTPRHALYQWLDSLGIRDVVTRGDLDDWLKSQSIASFGLETKPTPLAFRSKS